MAIGVFIRRDSHIRGVGRGRGAGEVQVRRRTGVPDTHMTGTEEALEWQRNSQCFYSGVVNMNFDDESDEDVLDLVVLANLNKQRQFWVHPLWLESEKSGMFNIMRELDMYPKRFQNFYRMSHECFYKVLSLVKNRLLRKTTKWREPVCPEERLLITLR